MFSFTVCFILYHSVIYLCFSLLFFFKQKTAYEMRISDWSSDVCSSDLLLTEDYYVFNKIAKGLIGTNNVDTNSRLCMSSAVAGYKQTLGAEIGRASCRERVCQYV